MYICLKCGHIFDEGEEKRWSESRGEFWGTPCSEEMAGCPICKGDYEKAKHCDICGGEYLEEELNGGVCDYCIEEQKNNIDLCYKIGGNCNEKIELNCFLASMFEPSEIELILLNALKEVQKTEKVDCSPFIEIDKSWFGELLAEEVKKDEQGKKKSR